MRQKNRQTSRTKVYNSLISFYILLENACKNAICIVLSFSLLELMFDREFNKSLSILKNMKLNRSVLSIYYKDGVWVDVMFIKIKTPLSLLYLSNIIKTVMFLFTVFFIYLVSDQSIYKEILVPITIVYIYSFFFFDHDVYLSEEEEEE